METVKKRATNFSAKEESILIEIVRKYKNLIECKKSDTNTNKIKLQAWTAVAKEYNSICGENYRDAKMLRCKYENLKKRTKKKFADEKVIRCGTGGGPDEKIDISELDISIKDIIGKQLTGNISEFDDDCVEEIIPTEFIQEEELLKFSDEASTSSRYTVIDNTDHDYSTKNKENCFPIQGKCSFQQDEINSNRMQIQNECVLELSDVPSCSSVSISRKQDHLRAIPKKEQNSSNALAVQDWSSYTPEQLKMPKSSPLRINQAPRSRDHKTIH